jgi:hypothetical protein
MSNPIIKIRRHVGWNQEADDPCINTDVDTDLLWTPGLVKKIYEFVGLNFSASDIVKEIGIRDIVWPDSPEFSANDFNKLDYREIVAKWDEKYCKLFGYCEEGSSPLRNLFTFELFLKKKCRPNYKKELTKKERTSHFENKLSVFLNDTSRVTACGDVEYCSTILGQPFYNFPTFGLAIGKSEADLYEQDQEKCANDILTLIKHFKWVEYKKEPYKNLFGIDRDKNLYYPILTLFSSILRRHLSEQDEDGKYGTKQSAISSMKTNSPPLKRNVLDKARELFNKLDDESIHYFLAEVLRKYKKDLFGLAKNDEMTRKKFDLQIKNRIKSEWILRDTGLGKTLDENIGFLQSDIVFSKKDKCADADGEDPDDSSDGGTEGGDTGTHEAAQLEEMLIIILDEIESTLLKEEVKFKGADVPVGRSTMSTNVSSSRSSKGSKNVPEFCKIDWPRSKRTNGSTSGIKTNTEISAAWGWIFPFLPAQPKITSGIRTEKHQLELIIDFSKKENLTVPQEVSDYYDSMSDGTSFSPAPAVQKNVETLVSALNKKEVYIAMPGESNHNKGTALDIGSREYSRVENIILTIVGEVPKLRLTTRQEPNNGNGAVHVNIQQAPSPEQDKIDAIWKKIKDCK